MKKWVISLLICIAAAGIWLLGVRPSTVQYHDKPESIAELQKITIGRMDQWILIRGEDRNNPVLLWLHGGPGSSQMPLAHHLDTQLEKEFVVVHWDQRGAGKSNHRHFDERTMTVSQYVDDAVELIMYLKGYLGYQQLFFLGHSWGTQFGIQLASSRPDLITCYIGVSQVVDNVRANEIAYAWLMQQAQSADDKKTLQALDDLGRPPYSHSQYRKLAGMVVDYGGNYDIEMRRLAAIALRAPEYTVLDYGRMLRGMIRGGGPLHDPQHMIRIQVTEDFPKLEVPAFFIMGDKDYNTPLELVREYCQLLDAPMKDLYIMEDAAHTPFLKDPEEFAKLLAGIKELVYGY